MTGPRRGAVFLLTDYGERDEFAGVTRAVVLRTAPGAPVVDLTHGIPPFDVRAGALALARCVGFIGPGVVIAVVDPGVGSGRRAVAVAVRGGVDSAFDGPGALVGPDNGLLGWAVEALGGAVAAVALPASAGPGATFDGRDLFAPVAARLWAGASLNDVGLPIDPAGLVTLPPPRLRVISVPAGPRPPGPGSTPTRGGSVEAEVIWVDRFGNAQLAARADDATSAGLDDVVEIQVATTTWRARAVTSFAQLEGDQIGIMVDANGHLSLVCLRRPAATVLGVGAGDMVTLIRAPGAA